MRNRFMGSIVALVAVLASSAGVFAQGARPPQTARAATAASVPDLSGLWSPVGTNTFDPADPSGKRASDLTRYPMSPLGLEEFNANKVAHGANQQEQSNDPTNKCFPPGAPRSYVNPYPVEFVQSRNRLAMLFEYDVVYRIVYLDGRPHPEDGVPTWMGHSVGKWEGDTLVVHSTGFNGKSWLDRIGHPYSEELQLTERFRLVDKDTLQLDITFHDPKMYSRDWTGQKIFKLKPTWELKEYICEDNYTFDDFQTATGGAFVP